MNIGFINIPLPFLVVFVIIVFNILSVVGKKVVVDDETTPFNYDEEPELTAYDLLVEARRKAMQSDEDSDSLVSVVGSMKNDSSVVQEQMPQESEERVRIKDEFYQLKSSDYPNRRLTVNLSQLQQAVVMKEILDKPKSLR
jgi:hypothetical protein